MLKALHGWYQWKAEIESNLEVPSIQSTFWVMWRKFNIKLSHSVFTWPLFVRKCLFFQTNQPFTQTCDICTHIVSYMVGKLLKRSTFLRTQLHSYDANLKSYEFIPHAGISYMWDLTPHHIRRKTTGDEEKSRLWNQGCKGFYGPQGHRTPKWGSMAQKAMEPQNGVPWPKDFWNPLQ